MTEYAIWLQGENGSLTSMGVVDTRSPEVAVQQVAKQRHEEAGETAGTYVAVVKSAVTEVKVAVNPSVEVQIESDRVIKPRQRRQEQPAEPAVA